MPQSVVESIPARRERLLLALIVLAHVIVGTCYAVWTPAWQVPDEPAHYNYLWHIAETGHLPELEPGDYPAEYLEEIKARGFPPEMSIDPIRYEAHQPPLYYLIAATWYRLWAALSGEAPPLVALRLLSVALGVGVVLGAYGVAKRAAGPAAGAGTTTGGAHIALGAAALVATLPMHVAMTSAVNSDVLAELLLVMVGGIVIGLGPGRWSWRRAVVLGVLLGLAFLTKMQSYVAFAITGLAFVWDVIVSREDGLEPLTPGRTRDFQIAPDRAHDGPEPLTPGCSRDFQIAPHRVQDGLEPLTPGRSRDFQIAPHRVQGGLEPLTPGRSRDFQIAPHRVQDGLEPLTPGCSRDLQIAPHRVQDGLEPLTPGCSRDLQIAPVAIMAACVALLAAPWLIRNMRVYGPGDPFGLGRHAEVVVGQLTTGEYIAANGWGALLRALFVTTFRSFWGQFGWMGVVLPQRVYLGLALLSGLVALGFAQWLVETIRSRALTPHRARALAILAAWIAATTAGYLWWNTQYLQHQGRYLFPALAPLGVAFALGLRRLLVGRQRLALIGLGLAAAAILVWGLLTDDIRGFTLALTVGAMLALPACRWIERRWPGAAMGLVLAGMAGLSLFCLFVHIVPTLS